LQKEFLPQLCSNSAKLKDYYAILDIPVTATLPEIKQAYRRLAKIYHPDKQNDDPYALTKFNEIKEAYETLTNPGKKELYLQERWLNKASGINSYEDIITPPYILKKSLELNKSVSQMDVYRMDHKNIQTRICNLLSDEVVEKLLAFNEKEINTSIISILLNAARPLPPAQTKTVAATLKKLATSDKKLLQTIERAVQQKNIVYRKRKYKPLIILAVVIILCLIIYFSGC
jgi:curved DNA-binding protein CbpA